ncbi:MAG TPA: PDZ domain-containing protein [Candidatus Eremiobacteraceae bacterium]|nr:PDZ domain-containing protein [Candidatus Eremiobacteraceae bacterium]
MKKNIWIGAAGIAVLAPALMALPQQSTQSTAPSTPDKDGVRVLRQELGDEPGRRTILISTDEEGGPSFLGIEAREVTPENVKQFKLQAERGVVVGRVAPDSPASKAGLKETDVITEVDGQRVEGATQFRRMIREIPAGRTVQLTVWRDGRAQTLSAKLDQAEELHRAMSATMPGSFAFRMPDVEVQEMPELHEAPDGPDGPIVALGDGGDLVIPSSHPRLGIDAEDIGGQLGNFFGAPGGEGVLVRSVSTGSAAEKGGLKAGDVITKFDGERIRSLGELREKLAAKNDMATLTVTRNKSEMTLNVALPAAPANVRHHAVHSTNI